MHSKIVLHVVTDDISFDRMALPGEIYNTIQYVFPQPFTSHFLNGFVNVLIVPSSKFRRCNTTGIDWKLKFYN